MPPLLRIGLFGQMHVADGAGRSMLPSTRKARAVLAVLALASPRPVLRAQLTGLLWSRREREQARASLRQAVYELQDALKPTGVGLLEAGREALALRDAGVWVDAWPLVRRTPPDPAVLDWCRAPLLQDLRSIDPAFDSWLSTEQEAITRRAREMAEELLSACQDCSEALTAAARLLQIDSGHEGAWRALIRAHAERGDRAAALDAFERCRAALLERNQIGPSRETEALVASIRHPGARDWLPTGLAAAMPQPPEPPQTTVAGVLRGLRSQRVRLGIVAPRATEGSQTDWLAAGLAEEITIGLARFGSISCVPCGSFPMGGAPLLTPEMFIKHFDLDFLLDGLVQRSRERVRVSLRLMDVRAGGEVVWSTRLDRDAGDILSLQDELAAEAVAQMEPVLLLWESPASQVLRAGNPAARDLLRQAIVRFVGLERPEFGIAGNMLAQCLALDPNDAKPLTWFAHWHIFALGQGWAEDIPGSVSRLRELAERALALDPNDARGLALAGHVRSYIECRPEEGASLLDQAVAANPNLSLAWALAGLARTYRGRHDEAIRFINRARQLAHNDPLAFFFEGALAIPYLLTGEFETALDISRRSVLINNGCSSAFKTYLAVLGHLGHEEEAAGARQRLLALEPGFSVSSALERSPIQSGEDRDRYADGLRLGGLA